MRPWDLYVKWLVDNPNESKESRQLYLDTPQEVTQDARALYTRERYPRTVFSKIAQAWVVEEEWPAWVAYAKEKAYDHKARRLVV